MIILSLKYITLVIIILQISNCKSFFNETSNNDKNIKEINDLSEDKHYFRNNEIKSIENSITLDENNATTLKKDQIFSSVRCVGWDFLPKSSYSKKTCHFKNICLSNSIWYYIIEDGDILPSGIPPLVTTQPGNSFEVVPPTNIIFKVVTKEIYNQIVNFESLGIAFEQYNGVSFGHVLGDEVLPMFRAMKIFSLEEFSDTLSPIEVVPENKLMYSCRNSKTPHVQEHLSWCSKYREKVYPLLTNTLPVEATAVNKCYRNFIIGTGSLTDHCRDETVHGREIVNSDCNHGAASVFKEFYFNVQRRMKKSPSNKTMNQILIVKISRRFSSNMQEVINEISPYARQNLVFTQLHDIAERTVEEQFDILQSTKVLVCPVGSISFLIFFLPPGASAILLYEIEPLDHNLFSHFGHVRVTYVETINVTEAVQTMKYMIKTSFLF